MQVSPENNLPASDAQTEEENSTGRCVKSFLNVCPREQIINNKSHWAWCNLWWILFSCTEELSRMVIAGGERVSVWKWLLHIRVQCWTPNSQFMQISWQTQATVSYLRRTDESSHVMSWSLDEEDGLPAGLGTLFHLSGKQCCLPRILMMLHLLSLVSEACSGSERWKLKVLLWIVLTCSVVIFK